MSTELSEVSSLIWSRHANFIGNQTTNVIYS